MAHLAGPACLLDWLRSKLKPRGGRKVQAGEVPGVRDWKTFFSDLQNDARGRARLRPCAGRTTIARAVSGSFAATRCAK
eukprot:3230505-Alexandrium_andersonii.AAC.1